MFLTIFTPTYNRAQHLKEAFASLQNQRFRDFEWLVIDDGSTDDTEAVVKALAASDSSISMRYFRKKNGGKHTAINYASDLAEGDFFLFLDSDDKLCAGALDILIPHLDKIKNDDSVGALAAIRLSDYGTPLGLEPGHTVTGCWLKLQAKKILDGDYTWCMKTALLKSYKFPVFKGERFLTEAIAFNRMLKNYEVVYIPEELEIGGYNADGLTFNSDAIFRNNPNGYRLYHKELMKYDEFGMKCKLISGIKYWKYPFKINELPAEIRPTLSLRLFQMPAKCFYVLKNIKEKTVAVMPKSLKTRIIKLKKRDCKIGSHCVIDNSILAGKNKISNNVSIRDSVVGFSTYVFDNCILNRCDIGSFSTIGHGCVIGAVAPQWKCISTSNVINLKGELNPESFYKNQALVKIGSDVWIGNNVSISPGVNIGHGAIIESNSVITENIEPYSIWSGIPAKLVKKRFDDSTIARLLDYKWWAKGNDWLCSNISRFKDRVSFFDPK